MTAPSSQPPTMVTSLIRTCSPMAAGWLIALPIAKPIEDALGVDDATARGAVAAAVAAVAGAGYYAGVRWAERRWPALGVLLGRATQPVYDGTARGDGSGQPLPEVPASYYAPNATPLEPLDPKGPAA